MCGGGGGSSQPTSQTVTQVTIPPELMPYAKKALGTAEDLVYNKPYETYGGQRFAGVNPLQQTAFEQIQQQQITPQTGQATGFAGLAGIQAQQLGNYSPAQYQGLDVNYLGTQAPNLQQYQMGAPQQVAAQQFGLSSLQPYMSPYMQDVVETQKREAISDYGRQLPGIGAAAARMGARGGTREALLRSEAQRNLMGQLQGIQSAGTQQAFQQAQQQYGMDRAQAMQAALANQAAGLTYGQANLQAALQTQGLGAQQSMQSQLANQQAQLQAQQQALGQRQFGSEFGERSRQFGAGLGLQGVQQQLAAAGLLGNLGQQQFGQQQAINQAQMAAGTQLQGMEQQRLGAAYEDFINRQRYPYTQLGFMSDLIRGTPTAGGIQTMYQSSPSMMNQLAGAGMTAYGLGSMFGKG